MAADLRRPLLALIFALPLGLAACGEREPAEPDPAAAPDASEQTDQDIPAEIDPAEDAAPEADAPAAEAEAAPAAAEGTLEWAVGGEWRAEQSGRDEWRNPAETLDFFGVDPSGTVIEIWPAAGWYTQILAPWIAANGGTYVAAHFPANGEDTQAFLDNYRERFSGALYGEIEIAEFGPGTGDLVRPGSADAVLTFRNVHNWMARGFEQKAFADFHQALRPGGILGVVEHRLPASMVQDPRAASGYVQQDYVIALATEAGFEFIGASEVNANPADTADHPFGVWTLPPVSRTSALGEPDDADFDRAPYDAIGESDRMTLLFRKPDGPLDVDGEGGEPDDEDDGDEGR
ncbi:class I SAM-dependent methyltransferase [Glycocaulis profundi]|nr:class I SAM-dependent methyltransferase [Glycocaulis profundi]